MTHAPSPTSTYNRYQGQGYYLDDSESPTPAAETASPVEELTEIQKETAGFVVEEYKPQHVTLPSRDPRIAGMSKKQLKKHAKMSEQQLVLLGLQGIDFNAVLAGATVVVEGEAPKEAAGDKADKPAQPDADLSPDVQATMKAQKSMVFSEKIRILVLGCRTV